MRIRPYKRGAGVSDEENERSILRYYDRLATTNPLTGRPYRPEYYKLLDDDEFLEMRKPKNIQRLIESFQTQQVTVLTAGTGVGKSTYIGSHLLFYLRNIVGTRAKVYMTQPRRPAATGVTGRVAQLLDVELGKEVGYKIGDDVMATDKSKLVIVTEAILLQMMKEDITVRDIHGIIIDEAHERNVDTDMLLLMIKRLIMSGRRLDLRVVVMSATAEVATFTRYFNVQSPIEIQGSTYDIKQNWASFIPKDDKLLEAGIDKIVDVCRNKSVDRGNILLFMSSKNDTIKGRDMLEQRAAEIPMSFVALALSGGTPADEQREITRKNAKEYGVDIKIIIATNIAEASVTIDDLKIVVDSGRANIQSFDTKCDQSALTLSWISKASFRQRKGRVGRTSPGEVFTLYTEAKYNEMQAFPSPQIVLTDITDKIFSLMSVDEFASRPALDSVLDEMITPPPKDKREFAYRKFEDLGFMDAAGELTSAGLRCRGFPSNVELSRALYMSSSYGCRQEMMTLGAMMMVDTDANGISTFFQAKDVPVNIHLKNAGTIFSMYLAMSQMLILEDDPARLSNFLRKYNLSFPQMTVARNNYGKILNKLDALYASYPQFIDGQRVRVDMPDRESWLTGPISGSIFERLSRCLLHGYCRNIADMPADARRPKTRENILTKCKFDLKDGFDITHEGFAMYLSMNLNTRSRKSLASGIVDVRPEWINDAARHLLREKSVR